MIVKKESVKEFFQGKKYYAPMYQGEFYWSNEQNWKVFFEDLQEATKGEKHYFFGNILLGKLDNTSKIDIIDGYQRLTTIVIFVRAMLNVLEKRAKKERLDKEIENENFLESVKKVYLIDDYKAKLEALRYDKSFFEHFIIQNKNTSRTHRTHFKEAKEFFEKSLKKLDTKEILGIFKTLQNAEILNIYFENKREAVMMFELQHNRGQETILPDIEALESYFVYQLSIYCSAGEFENKLHTITHIFKDIYAHIISNLSADNYDFYYETYGRHILSYYNRSLFGFDYYDYDDNCNYKKYFKDVAIENKIAWIEQYVKGLKEAFIHLADFNIRKRILSNLYIKQAVYPFIIKAYRLFGKDKEKIERVFHILDIFVSTHFISRRIDSRLNEILINFTKVEDLKNGLESLFLKAIKDLNEWHWWKKL